MILAGTCAWSADSSAAYTGTYAQELTKEVAANNPEVTAAAMHVAPPKSKGNVVIASTDAGRLGAHSSAADLAVIKSGKTAVAQAGDHTVVRLPLRDVSGDTVGALSLTFKAGTDQAAATRSAERIRDGLQRRISHVANLMEPYPYDPKVSNHTMAQQLVEQTMAKYPELEIFALHATPPGSKTNIIIGSNIGRIGKAADDDDMRVVNTGNPNLEVNDTGNRFEVEMPLRDQAGTIIGAVSTVFGYKAGADKAALRAHGEQINAELQRQIPNSAALFQPAH
jgi:hypothetical protein